MGTPKHKTPQGKGLSQNNTPKTGGKQTPKGKPGTPGGKPNTPKAGTPKAGTPKVINVQTPKGTSPKGTPKGNTPKGNTPKGGKALTPKAGTPKGFSPKNKQTPQQMKQLQNGKGSSTPQPQKGAKESGKKTPKSAPPSHIKRKKLDEEISDEEFDEDFEELLGKSKSPAHKKRAVTADSDEEDDSDFDLDDDDDLSELSDEDDSDMDGDESDDEDDSEEESAPAKKKLKTDVKKQDVAAKKVESPSKGKKAEQEVKKAPKRKADSAVGKAVFNEDDKRRDEQSKRTLFIKNYPYDVTEEDIKKLSKDILSVNLHFSFKSRSKENSKGYGFILFKDEATAVKNLKALKNKQLKGESLFVDYCGSKSQHSDVKGKATADEYDPLKLYITGFEPKTKNEKLKSLFPAASRIERPIRHANNAPCNYAFVIFESEQAAKQSHDKMKNTLVDGRPLVVLHAKKQKTRAEKRKQEKKDAGGPGAKKQKVTTQKKVAEDDDDEDDNDMDDDDDDDDDDEESSD